MPNWVSNTLYITGPASDAASLRSLVTTNESKFDFNKVIPMPQAIKESECSSVAATAWELKYGDWHSLEGQYGPRHYGSPEAAMKAARSVDEWRPSLLPSQDRSPFLRPRLPRTFDELADAVQTLVLKYGHPHWYSWARENWGTKWSASDAGWMSPSQAAKREVEQLAYFDTAWSPPLLVIMTLSRRYPCLILRLEYDEPLMGYRGFRTFEAGVITAEKRETYDC